MDNVEMSVTKEDIEFWRKWVCAEYGRLVAEGRGVEAKEWARTEMSLRAVAQFARRGVLG